MEEDKSISEETERIVFVQLMEQIRKQDDLVHSWTKFFPSIQAGLATALAFLIQLGGQGNNLIKTVGLFVLPILGIITTVFMTNTIIGELKWQGRYISALGKLESIPRIYDIDPDPNQLGNQARRFRRLQRFLILMWATLLLLVIEVQLNLFSQHLAGLL